MKKRDLYVSMVLLAVVGYAAYKRATNNSVMASEGVKQTITSVKETELIDPTISNKITDTVEWVDTPKSERLKTSGFAVQ